VKSQDQVQENEQITFYDQVNFVVFILPNYSVTQNFPAMTDMIGQLPEFYGVSDDWNVYVERLDQFFVVNDIPETKRTALLISVIGTHSYKTLRELCHPDLPKQKSFDELCELLRKQFSPQIAIFRERSNFYAARQYPAENVTAWYGRIKKLSVDCKFGENLEKILLDKFITGMKTGQVLDRMCEENETLTLEAATTMAINKECAVIETVGLNHMTNQFGNDFCVECSSKASSEHELNVAAAPAPVPAAKKRRARGRGGRGRGAPKPTPNEPDEIEE
jgi:hypothetical protein